MSHNMRIELASEEGTRKGPSTINSPTSLRSSIRKHKMHSKISNLSHQSQREQLWHQSSMSMTRDQSPRHKIPNSIRFVPIEEEALKKGQFLNLELRRDIKTEQGVRFPKSKRPEHFVKGLGDAGPSPASYNSNRFLEDNQYSTLQYDNPESCDSATKTKWSIKGRSFSNFKNHHKTYVSHSKHRVYQPENIEGNPGPGKYNQSFITKKQHSSYSMRSPLKRFNQTIAVTPGPGAYGEVYGKRTISPNAKRTIPLSKRTYLTKFEDFPSAHSYQITRFLE